MTPRPTAAELLKTPGALLNRSDLRELGLQRGAVDAVFRALDVVILSAYSRPMIRVEDYLELTTTARSARTSSLPSATWPTSIHDCAGHEPQRPGPNACDVSSAAVSSPTASVAGRRTSQPTRTSPPRLSSTAPSAPRGSSESGRDEPERDT
jgi:hypothetical protein